MDPSGARRFLQPALYLAVAVLAHGLLFLIPGEWGKPDSGTTRGIRVKVQGEARSAAATPRPATATSPPTASAAPSALARKDSAPGAPGGGGGTESTGGPVAGDAPPTSEYGSYLARLKSEGVQGWARDSAGKLRQGWKGSGKSGNGWGGGSGTGTGSGTGGGTGPGTGGGGYLDPRVRTVVTSYPPTSIEKRHTQVPYPEIRVRKHEYVTGWWNVYIQVWTDGQGKVVRKTVLRPETDGALERIFITQVKREIEKWSFERKEAEINVDVRFYVE
ncbi:MAG: hypothetical protein C4529_03625 [Deltaproteobacteria bacterium]|nr:MAG: hypothetical protein C4529_03625 [Deltaproteobacteria bacterium]